MEHDISKMSSEELRILAHELGQQVIECRRVADLLRENGEKCAEALKICDARFRGYFELPLIGIAIMTLSKNRIEANDRLCDMTGYSRQELLSMTWEELTHPDHVAQDIAQFDRLLAGLSDDFSADTRLIRRNGDILHIGLAVGCVRKPDGAADCFVALLRDITHRKWADAEVRNSVETIRALFNAITESLVLTDKDGTVLTSNATAALRMGRSADQIIGRSLYDFFPPRISQSRMRYFLDVIETGKPVRFEDKREGRWFDISAYPISDPQGNVTKLAIYACDITERKKSEEAIKKHASDLMRKTTDLEESNIALKVLLTQREKDKSEIEDRILRNVRESVLPLVEKLKAGLSDPRKKAIAEIIESELNNLVSPFRHRLSSARLLLTPQEIRIATLIKSGKDGKEIADILNISLTTLNFHRRSLRKKLGLTHSDANLRTYLLSLSE